MNKGGGLVPPVTTTVLNRREVVIPAGSRLADGPQPVWNHPTPGTHVWGWVTVAELEWLAQQALDMTSIVEIGSLHGRSAFALASGCDGPVYCIDTWGDNDDHDAFLRSMTGVRNAHDIQGVSAEAGEKVSGDVDMVYLADPRSSKRLERDIEYWMPRVRRLICGHSYRREGYPFVKPVIDGMFGDEAEHVHDTSIWAVVTEGW